MQVFFCEFAKLGLSEPRLSGYKRTSSDSDYDCLLRYIWNTKLCESFYFPLQMLEVSLRNGVHDALAQRYQTPLWFDSGVLGWHQEKNIESVRNNRLKGENLNNADKIVAELNFGFWSALMNKSYSSSLVPVLLKTVFKQVQNDSSRKKQSFIQGWLTEIRQFRNRIYHYEPIWRFRDLAVKYNKIMQFILWINPELFRIVLRMSTFHEVYSAGTLPYKSAVQDALSGGSIFSFNG